MLVYSRNPESNIDRVNFLTVQTMYLPAMTSKIKEGNVVLGMEGSISKSEDFNTLLWPICYFALTS